MFNNLIESSSHMSELKRRGSFVLFTVITYVLAFIVAGVASIYAYDARLDDPETEIVMLSPLDFPPDNPTPAPRPVTGASGGGSRSQSYVRRNPTAPVNHPNLVPPSTSAAPNPNPPVPTGAHVVRGDHDSDPGISGPGRNGAEGSGNDLGARPPIVDIEPPPQPPVVEKPKPRLVHRNILNGEALLLPKPPYPPLAKQMGMQGTVLVQVLIDESGKVISAKAVSGNPALVTAAQRAALGARFSPTRLNDQPVKVSGVITYNFVLQ